MLLAALSMPLSIATSGSLQQRQQCMAVELRAVLDIYLIHMIRYIPTYYSRATINSTPFIRSFANEYSQRLRHLEDGYQWQWKKFSGRLQLFNLSVHNSTDFLSVAQAIFLTRAVIILLTTYPSLYRQHNTAINTRFNLKVDTSI